MTVYKSRTGYRKTQLHGSQTNKRGRGREKANGEEEKRRAGRNNVKGRGTTASQKPQLHGNQTKKRGRGRERQMPRKRREEREGTM